MVGESRSRRTRFRKIAEGGRVGKWMGESHRNDVARELDCCDSMIYIKGFVERYYLCLYY